MQKEGTTNASLVDEQQISIAEAKNYFQQNFSEVKSAEVLKNNLNPTAFQKIKKTVLWDEAKEYEISIGKAVRVPIYYDKQYIYKAGKNQQAMDLYNLSHLMIYKDKSNKIHTEWVVALPDDDYMDKEQKIGASFSGFIAIRDWYGTLLNGFKIDNKNEIHFISGYSESGQAVSGLKTMAYETIRTCPDLSVTICTLSLTNGNESLECTVSSVCFNHLVFGGGSNVNNGGMPASGSPASGGPGLTYPKDYIPNRNKCPENNGVALESTSGITTMWVNPEFNYFNPGEIAGDPCGESNKNIRFTQSFKNDPKLQCIFGKLVEISANWKNSSSPFISNLFANFTLNDDIFYDLRDLNDLSLNGETTNPSSNTYYVTINKETYNSRTSLLVARTIVHETIHANISRNLKYATPNGGFYEDLMKYKLRDPNNSNVSSHNYMVDNYINPIAFFFGAIRQQ